MHETTQISNLPSRGGDGESPSNCRCDSSCKNRPTTEIDVTLRILNGSQRRWMLLSFRSPHKMQMEVCKSLLVNIPADRVCPWVTSIAKSIFFSDRLCWCKWFPYMIRIPAVSRMTVQKLKHNQPLIPVTVRFQEAWRQHSEVSIGLEHSVETKEEDTEPALELVWRSYKN